MYVNSGWMLALITLAQSESVDVDASLLAVLVVTVDRSTAALKRLLGGNGSLGFVSG